jgi:hypothetical protein
MMILSPAGETLPQAFRIFISLYLSLYLYSIALALDMIAYNYLIVFICIYILLARVTKPVAPIIMVLVD